MQKKLIDNYNRYLNYLRVSITDRCNLRCLYCVPQGMIPKVSHDEVLRYEEILRIVNLAARLGITKVRVTGGEPLIRKGVYAFLEALNRIEAITGCLLDNQWGPFKSKCRTYLVGRRSTHQYQPGYPGPL